MVADGVFTPAHVLADAIRQREISSVEIVDAYLAQISRHNPNLNAVVTLDEEGARARAQEADAAFGRARRGALFTACRSPWRMPTPPRGYA
jgi:amidase